MSVNVIAIDGPAASGKSTAARELAAAIPGAVCINTGSMYRAVAWTAMRDGMEPAPPDRDRLNRLLETIRMRFVSTPEGCELEVDGERPGNALRTPEVSAGASAIATIPEVRRKLVELQRAMAAEQMIVMEGRDIGTVVFPDAKYKFFLTASPEVRARRRLLQDGGNPDPAEVARVAAEIAARDKTDSTRADSPLRRAEDAVLIDNSTFSREETIQRMLERIQRKMTVMPYRVPYADTDQMGVVYYANYLVYFERFRNELLRDAGYTYRRLEEDGIAMPVIEAVCSYKASAKYDDLLEITGRFAEAKGVKVKIECEVRREGKILVEGYTVHACMDLKSGRPTRPPEFIRELLLKP